MRLAPASLIFLLAILTGSAGPYTVVSAQEAAGGRRPEAWGGLGAGVGSMGFGASLFAAARVSGPIMASFHAAGVKGGEGLFSPVDVVGDLALGVGLYRFGAKAFASASVGGGLVRGAKRGRDLPRTCSTCPSGYEVITYDVPGVALDLFFGQYPRGGLSAGLHLFGNLNGEQPFGGISIQVISTTGE